VDFSDYMHRMLENVRRNWYAVMPQSAMLGERGRVLLRFKIMANGSVPNDFGVATTQHFVGHLNMQLFVDRIVPTFRHDVGPLRAFGAGISAPFEQERLTPFAAWYRDAAAKGCRLRCVFEDTPMFRGLVRELQLRNLDEGLLGPRYEEESLITEAGTSHFDLIDPARIDGHVQALRERMAG